VTDWLLGYINSIESDSELEKKIYAAIQAWKNDEDIAACAAWAAANRACRPNTIDWAYTMRLYGLALIRVQREVEGSFALERADAWLQLHGFLPITWDELTQALSLPA
jgi:hypothetical protein